MKLLIVFCSLPAFKKLSNKITDNKESMCLLLVI